MDFGRVRECIFLLLLRLPLPAAGCGVGDVVANKRTFTHIHKQTHLHISYLSKYKNTSNDMIYLFWFEFKVLSSSFVGSFNILDAFVNDNREPGTFSSLSRARCGGENQTNIMISFHFLPHIHIYSRATANTLIAFRIEFTPMYLI